MSDQRNFVILLGPPGAGKGTQATRASLRTGLLHVSTGDLFREHLRNGTELGNLAKSYMDKGELVPDDVTIRMLLERIDRDDASAGCLLDGFPRTREQAEALDEALTSRSGAVAATVLIDVSDEVVNNRLGARISCSSCGTVFHKHFNPPDDANPCCDNVDLVQRDDDQPEAIALRLQVYSDQTAPLIAYYGTAGKLRRVNGDQSPGEVEDDVYASLRELIE
ncbi:MAG: adenylate kinase [Chloroflexota bacterium]|nr:adenylate kinase [Chloroflexota bacterium]MDE2895663.1 adenylate kinase [Chloroflexota bacterium]